MVLIWNEQSVWLNPSFLTDSLQMDYPSETSLCTAAPSPPKKSEKGCLWERERLYTGQFQTDKPLISSCCVKTANNKIPVSSVLIIAKDCTERLPAVALSIGLIIPQLMRFGSRGQGECFFSDTPPKCLDRDCLGRRRTGTRHGSVYRSVIEKQGIVVSRQRVLQTMTSLRVVSLVFRGHGEN